MSKSVAMALGALTGVVTLIAMLRLIAGAFTGPMTTFALGFGLAATVPMVAYAAWRARQSRLAPRSTAIVLGANALGLVLVWLFTFGPVLALACALVAFVVIWVNDLPVQPRGESTYVSMEDLQSDEQD